MSPTGYDGAVMAPDELERLLARIRTTAAMMHEAQTEADRQRARLYKLLREARAAGGAGYGRLAEAAGLSRARVQQILGTEA